MKLPYLLVMLLAAGVASFSVVDVIYFQGLGYSIAFIALMVSVFNIAVALSELPFAILFDRYSSKLSLYIGFSIRILAFALFAANFGASFFLLAQALAGIATAASSGTTVALVLNEVKEKSYANMAVERGRLTFLSGLGSLGGGAVGAVFYYFNPSWIWIAAIVFFLLGTCVLYFFHDKPAEGADETVSDLLQSWLEIFRFRSTYLLVLCNASAIGPIILWQIKFDAVSLWFVVLGFFIITASTTVGSRVFKRMNLGVEHIRYVAIVNVLAAVAFAFSTTPMLVAVTFGFHVVAHVIMAIQLEGLFHSNVQNKIRASASSIISLADSLVVAVCAPLVGLLADTMGLAEAIVVSAVLYVAIGLLTAFPQRQLNVGTLR